VHGREAKLVGNLIFGSRKRLPRRANANGFDRRNSFYAQNKPYARHFFKSVMTVKIKSGSRTELRKYAQRVVWFPNMPVNPL
jgi:hypothetical protein